MAQPSNEGKNYYTTGSGIKSYTTGSMATYTSNLYQEPTEIEVMQGKINFLQDTCRRAGAEIRELKDTVAKLEKLVGITSEDVVNKLRDAENYNRTED